MDACRKVSFGFSKCVKKNLSTSAVSTEPKKVEYIQCLEEKAIKIIGNEEKKDEPLIIPMLGSRMWHHRIINKTDADIFEPKIQPKKDLIDLSIQIKKEPIDSMSYEHNLTVENNTAIKVEESDEKPATLEAQAAKEILEDLKSSNKNVTEMNDLTLPLVDTESLRGKEESTLQDYEQIPVDVYGVAMLRGMGWKPGQGIGKNGRVVSAIIPELRPKGMGLGADKLAVKNQKIIAQQQEDLKIKKGAYVKIIAGKHNHNYGIIEGLDDDAGRLVVKLALGRNSISLSEFTVQPVTRVEYEQFKDKVCGNKKILDTSSRENGHEDQKQKSRKILRVSEEQNEKHRRSKSTGRRYNHSDNESDSDKYTRKRRSSSSCSSDRIVKKPKKSKKSKKHTKRSNSPEEKSRKRNKSEKNHKDRKSNRDSSDRKIHKKNKKLRSRSRSRSPRRR